jgi:multidrug resistance protein, MATE family
MTSAPPGSARELLTVSIPLIISASVMTIQICLDRILLTWNGQDDVAASMPAIMVYFTVLGLFGMTVQYATVFVSQYFGAKQTENIGPIVWQAIWLAVGFGILFLGGVPLAEQFFRLTGHAPEVAMRETQYFQALCYAALPTLIVYAINAYFSGLGATWTVLVINAFGIFVNLPLAYGWILGKWGFPSLGTAGAGYATVCGSTASMVLGLILLFTHKHAGEYGLHTFNFIQWTRLKRLLRFGLPNGLMHLVDMTAWTTFVFLVGSMSKLESAATNIAFTINMVSFLPLMGIGQGVEILVGRRQGEQKPDLSAKTTITGLKLAMCYAGAMSLAYYFFPGVFAAPFALGAKSEEWAKLAPVVLPLLTFMAIYTMADTVNIVVSFALRGAGDTRYVAAMGLILCWPCMVLPTWLATRNGWGVQGAWLCATIYIGILAVAFTLRFHSGKWRGMKVIEHREEAGLTTENTETTEKKIENEIKQ